MREVFRRRVRIRPPHRSTSSVMASSAAVCRRVDWAPMLRVGARQVTCGRVEVPNFETMMSFYIRDIVMLKRPCGRRMALSWRGGGM